MKRFFLMILMMCATVVAMQAQDEMFKKLGDNKDVTVVYVSKALLSFAGKMDIGNADIKSLADKLEMLEIYTSENSGAVKLMKNEAGKLQNGKTGMETLMKVKDGDTLVHFFARKGKNGNISELVMVSEEPDECSIIRLLGNFTMEDIEKVTGKQ